MSVRYGAPLIAGKAVYGTSDPGVLGSVIRATTGTGPNGPGLLYNDWDSAADDNKYFRALVISGAPAGTFVDEDGSITVPSDAAVGTYTINYELYVNYVLVGASTATLTVAAAAGADTTAPVLTGGMSVGAVTGSSIVFNWPSGTDAVGIVGYETNLNGAGWVDRGLVLTYTASGLTASTNYTLQVRAKDAAGNISTPVLSITQMTSAAVDGVAPVMTGAINSSQITENTYSISGWGATDAVGVTGYELSLNGGASYSNIGLVTAYAVVGRSAGATDAVRVRAYDAAGNRATPLSASVTLVAAAPAAPPPPPPTPSAGTARIALMATGQLVVLLP